MLLLALVCSAQAAPAQAKPAAPPKRVPGVELAEGITQLTGVAISPLLGVTVMGAWRYYQASAETRASLPWFCHPYFWGAGFCILGLCFMKDLLGTAAPPLVKKPLDLLEIFEDKLSALLVCSAFLPFLVSQFTQSTEPLEASIFVAAVPGLAVFPLDIRVILLPLAMIWFTVVWLSSHAINVLITLCPFGFIDSLLKLCKAALLSTVVGSSFISPFLGAAISVFVLIASLFVAPWAFRLMLFGTLFGHDILLPGRGRRGASPTEPHAFLAHTVGGTPIRTFGRLSRSAEGALVFTYRPFAVLPRRAVSLPPGPHIVEKGLLYPSLLYRDTANGRTPPALVFLPRYRAQEALIAEHYGIQEVRENVFTRGFQAVRHWLGEMYGAVGAPVLANRGNDR